MSTQAIFLLLLGVTLMLLQYTDAKPFLLLPANFFVLTTRAPSTSTSTSTPASYSSSTSTSSSVGGLFQLPVNLISRKLSLITNLLSSFGGSGGGNGILSIKRGFKFNTAATKSQPRRTTTERTTEPNTSFTPEVTTNTPKTTNYVTSTTTTTTTSTSTITSTTTERPSTTILTTTTETTTTPESIVSTTTEANVSSTTDVPTTIKPTVVPQRPAITTTTESDRESTTEFSKDYGYERPRQNSENEILDGDINRMYLPIPYNRI